MEKRLTDHELGIDITAITSEALIMGATQHLQETIKAIRTQKLAEYEAKDTSSTDIISQNE